MDVGRSQAFYELPVRAGEAEALIRIFVTAENEEALKGLAEVLKQGAVVSAEGAVDAVTGQPNVYLTFGSQEEAEAAEATGLAAGLALLFTTSAPFDGLLAPAAF